MATTIADKFEYDIPERAAALKVPPAVLKCLIMKLFNMATFSFLPDKINFVEEVKAFKPVVNGKGETLAVTRYGRLLLNGAEEGVVIGLKTGEGIDQATVEAYMLKAAPMVYDLSTWITK